MKILLPAENSIRERPDRSVLQAFLELEIVQRNLSKRWGSQRCRQHARKARRNYERTSIPVTLQQISVGKIHMTG